MNSIVITMVLLASALVCGCAADREAVRAGSVSRVSDIFREVTEGAPLPPGYAELRVVSSLKTHRQGLFPLHQDTHGTPDYALILTIDGEAGRLKGAPVREDCEPRRLRDPEAGDGIRYLFRTAIRLKEGSHTVTVASPDDDATVTGDVALAEGERYTLVLSPVYGMSANRLRPAFYGSTGFLQGVRGFRMVLQEEAL